MRKLLTVVGLAVALVAGCPMGVQAAKADKEAKKAVVAKESVEKTGVIEVVKADAAKKEKYDTVLLKVGEESFKLIPGKNKKVFKMLEVMAGKNVTVKGTLMPANPPKYPLAAIKVDEYTESTAAPSAAPAPATPAPAADAPAPAADAPAPAPAADTAAPATDAPAADAPAPAPTEGN
ncbi:MAG TPA: hypothetical protein PKO06_21005 [Candidatus Ozemobacteraceae bacterium]|nr:hypothetical protein [Candidatus Ozemobacteraceae bacterium]